MKVCLQEPKKGTCVTCATINALRHFGFDADFEELNQQLRLQRNHGKEGSYVHKAAKILRRDFAMDAIASRPAHLITDHMEAALETAQRFGTLLEQGYIGIIHRKETASSGHAVVLHEVTWDGDTPWFVTYDSNKRQAGGHWTYSALDYVWLVHGRQTMTQWLRLDELHQQGHPIQPTGRTGFFVRPSSLQPIAQAPERSPFRRRPPRRWPAPPVTEQR